MKKALCLSPHPDDVEFSMSGTILKYKSVTFYIVTFSAGCEGDKTSSIIRWDECRNFWIGCENVSISFMAEKLNSFTEEQWLNTLEQETSISSFDTLFIPSASDTHYEHRIVNSIGMALTRSNPITTIEYKSPSTLDTWMPNLFINIKPESDMDKYTRLLKFKSQQKNYMTFEGMKIFHSHASCYRKGLEQVEQFRIVMAYR